MPTEGQIYVFAVQSELDEGRYPSVRAIADKMGVAHTTVRDWLNGKSKPQPSTFPKICEAIDLGWLREIDYEYGLPPDDKLSPALRRRVAILRSRHPDLENIIQEDRQRAGRTRMGVLETTPWPRIAIESGRPEPQTLRPVADGEQIKVPVMGIAAAAGYMPAIHGTSDEFIAELSGGDYAEWDTVKRNHLLLRIEGNSMDPVLTHGSVVEVDTSRAPRTKEMVVAMISSEETPVVKYYWRKDYKVYLRSVNADSDAGRNYVFDLKERHPDQYLVWVHPVIRIQTAPMPADDLDWSHITDDE